MAISLPVACTRPTASRRIMCLVLACVLLVGTVTLVASLHQSRASSCDSRQSSPRQATLRSLIFSSSANRLLKKPDRAQPNLLEPDGVVGSVSRSKLPVQATLFDVSVPHTIWQTARSREDTPEFGTELFNSWTTKNPGYDHYFMDDEDIEAFIAAHYNDTVLQTFKEMPLGVMKADVFRYMIIHEYGGVWADMDTECRQPVRNWAPHGCYFSVALEDNDNFFCQWAFAAVPSHGALSSVLDLVLRKMINREYQNVKSDDGELFVHKLTGPAIWTDGILNYLGVDPEDRGSLKKLYDERREEWQKAGVCLLTDGEFVEMLINKHGHWHPDLLKGSWRSWTMERDSLLNDLREKEEQHEDTEQGDEEQDNVNREEQEDEQSEEEEQPEEDDGQSGREQQEEEQSEEEQQDKEQQNEEPSEEVQQEEEHAEEVRQPEEVQQPKEQQHKEQQQEEQQEQDKREKGEQTQEGQGGSQKRSRSSKKI